MIKLKLITSLDRPGWTSESSTGMFEAYNHKHIRGRILKYFYKKRRGLDKK